MIRLPITVRLTAAFAAATIVVMAGAGWFVYLRLRDDLDDSIGHTLAARSEAALDLVVGGGDVRSFPLEDPEESFVQLVDASGAVVSQAGLAGRSAVDGDRRRFVGDGPVGFEADVTGIDGRARVLVVPVPGRAGELVVVGQSLTDRDQALRELIASFVLGGPIAVAAAALAGYLLARAAFRPVEAMRAAAAELALTGTGGRLPVPDTRDEVQRLADTLNAMIDRVESSYQRERRFVTDASHELRTPIAVIRTELETYLGTEPLTSEQRAPLLAAIDECDSLAQLADDLLILTRTSETGLAIVTEPTPVATILRDACTRLVGRAAHHDRRIAIEQPDPDVTVDVDTVRIRQALTNLIDNALRHGAGTITLRGRARGDLVDIEVADEGPGFGPDIADHAFERFARSADARATGGAGLGLAIVHTIAEAHSGTASIVPPSTVRMTLPIRQPRTTSPAHTPS